ncbi:hypothetical protein B484DRAFT_426076 [Ochromonadaceae sp. CCMP2298]|nr:hypothetical protein B484DRAFT_426076 [Ochromonadaceae sp. CCMP2298]
MALSCNVLDHSGEHTRATTSKCGFDNAIGRAQGGFSFNRFGTRRCSGGLLYSCWDCDFDVCEGCYAWRTKSMSEREEVLATERRLVKTWERECKCERLQKKQEEGDREWKTFQEQRGDSTRLGLEELYRVQIRNETVLLLPAQRDSRRQLAYVVYTSSSTTYYSRKNHSTLRFDSTFATLPEANARALYLFYCKNKFKSSPGEVDAEESVAGSFVGPHKMLKLSVQPHDEKFVVGVLSKDKFEELGGSEEEEEEEEEEESDEESEEEEEVGEEEEEEEEVGEED